MAQANTKAVAQACSYCHERKIKCVLTEEAGCQACERNSVVCRLRHPKKVGRPHGAPHFAFSIFAQPEAVAGCKKQRRPNPTASTPPDLATSYSNNPSTHPVNPPGAPYVSVDDPPHLSFAAFTPPLADAPSLPKAYNHTSTNYRNSISRQTVTHFTHTSSCFDFSEKKPALHDELPYISDEDLPPLFVSETMNFADLFPDTPPEDKPMVEESSSSTFFSLFNLYIETHKALTEMRAGLHEVSIADLKDGQGVMRTIISINELGRITLNTCSTNMSPSLAIAFLMVVQGCELVEQILIAILPSGRPPTRSNSAESLSIDYSWTTCSPMFDGHPELSVEHITAFLQLDIHLSQFNSFVSTFMQMTQGQEPSANMLAVQCRKRLLHFHTQIRSVVDSMIPAWE